MIKQITTSLYDQFIADFELRSILSASSESAPLQGLRHTGFAHFKQLGFPNTKVEDWKYINLTPFLKDEFITEPEDDILAIDESVIVKANIPMLDCYKIVLVNGQYHPELSDTIATEGIYVSALSGAMNRPAFQAHFGRHIAMEKNPFTACGIISVFLNSACFAVKQ